MIRRARSGSKISSILAVALATAPLQNCAQPTARTTTYRIGDVTSTSGVEAVTLFETAMSRDIGRVTAVRQRIGGSLLIVLPTHDQMIYHGGPHPALMSDDAMRFVLGETEVAANFSAQAVERSHLFDTVQIVRSDATGSAGSYAYKLTFAKSPAGQWGWILTHAGNPLGQPVVLPGYADNATRLNAFNIAVSNAAVDLGARGMRLPLPNTVTGPSSGTGFFVNADGMMLSNFHVVDGCKALSVTRGDGAVEPASIVATDQVNDLAVLRAANHTGFSATFRAAAPIRQGEAIVVFGYPLVGLLSSKGNLSTGIVSALSGIKDDARQVQISAPVQPGNSGGPVFDGSGDVIAIATGKLNALNLARLTGDISQNINFAIKASVATGFLDANGIKYASTATKKPLETDDISDRAAAFTYMVKCDR